MLQLCCVGVSAGELSRALLPACRGTADGAGAGGGQGCGLCNASRAAQLLNRLLKAKAGPGGQELPVPGPRLLLHSAKLGAR